MRRLAAGLAVLLLLTGCTASGVQRADGGPPASTPAVPAPGAEVDVAAVEAARVAAGIADCPVPDGDAEPRPDGLPAVVLACLGGGGEIDLSQLRGRPMMINVWASWCPPCRAEAPYLSEVAGLSEDELLTVGLLYDETDPLAAVRLAELNAQRYPQLVDDGRAIQAPLRVPGPPVTFFVAADGELVHTHVGELTSSAQLRGLLATHLGVDVPG